MRPEGASEQDSKLPMARAPIQDLNAIGSDLAHAESEPFGRPFSIPTRYAGSNTPSLRAAGFEDSLSAVAFA
jgi:hypothetical protein